MALTHASATRNALGDLIDDRVNTGTGNAGGQVWIRDSTTVLMKFTFSNPAFGAANPTITAASMPKSGTGLAAGDADNFEVRDRDEALVYSGTVTATGGGGDLTLDNINIAVDQGGSLTSFTYTPSA